MSAAHAYRPRELRRRINLRARMRASSGWTDARILNISSRGMQIDALRAAVQGNTVEIWHGEHVWRKGTRAGLQSEQCVPVEELMSAGQASSLQLTGAQQWPQVERRRKPRTHDDSRLRSRAIEFASVAAIAASLGFGAFMMVEQAFARPLAHVQAALAGKRS